MNLQEWNNLQEGLMIVVGPVLIAATPLVVVAAILATVIGGVMSAIARLRRG